MICSLSVLPTKDTLLAILFWRGELPGTTYGRACEGAVCCPLQLLRPGKRQVRLHARKPSGKLYHTREAENNTVMMWCMPCSGARVKVGQRCEQQIRNLHMYHKSMLDVVRYQQLEHTHQRISTSSKTDCPKLGNIKQDKGI